PSVSPHSTQLPGAVAHNTFHVHGCISHFE
ncbi:MAG: hypothetical protein ACI9BK_003253, partial [Acidimicrobiales bacterium]